MKKMFDKENVALFVAFVAVLLAVWEGYEFRQHNRVAVMPSLSAYSSRDMSQDPSIDIGIVSVGLGPAKITSFDIFFNGKKEALYQGNGFTTYFKNTFTALNGAVADSDYLNKADSKLAVDSLIPSGEKLSLLRIEYKNKKAAKEFRKITAIIDEKLDVFACYCSVYDDHCQVVHLGKNDTLAPKHCK